MEHFKQKELSVNTPIGLLLFNATSTCGDLSSLRISSCKIDPMIPEGMSVECCIAVLLELASPITLNNFVFSCEWDNLGANGYGNTGEALDAWEWEFDNTLVVIGTEDAEWLGSRLSLHFGDTPEKYPITMNDNKIEIKIEKFPANTFLTLHFIVAWNFLPEKTDSSCWYAVDIPHKKVLQIFQGASGAGLESSNHGMPYTRHDRTSRSGL